MKTENVTDGFARLWLMIDSDSVWRLYEISFAEYTAMAFHAGENTTIIGSQTGGFDGNISKIVLPGGLTTYISGNGVYYPDGKETQRIGIIPDIEVKPSIKGIREGCDELLDKAIEVIRKSSFVHRCN